MLNHIRLLALRLFPALLVGGLSLALVSPAAAGGPPGYEPAYYGGGTYMINAIEVPQNPTQPAWARQAA